MQEAGFAIALWVLEMIAKVLHHSIRLTREENYVTPLAGTYLSQLVKALQTHL